jgi:hypothetical protein
MNEAAISSSICKLDMSGDLAVMVIAPLDIDRIY